MSKKLYSLLAVAMLFSMLLASCSAAPAAPVVEATTLATVATQAPVEPTAEPTAEPVDVEAVMAAVIADMPAEKGYSSVAPSKLNEELVESPIFLLDVRETAEVEKDGYINGAVNIPVREVLKNLDKLPAMDEPIVVYCASGHRGGFVMAALKALGYSNVRNLGGGLGAWTKAELPVESGLPEAPVAGTAPEISDQALFTLLDEFLTNLPEGFYSVKADKVNELLGTDTPPFLIDVRSQEEWDKAGYIEDARHIPLSEFMSTLDQLPAKDVPIIVYCASGHRGAVAAMTLRLMGWTDVTNIGGGLNAWKAAQFPVAGYVDWAMTWTEFLTGLPGDMYSTSAANLNAEMADKAPFLLDVREAGEVAEGYIAGAVNIPIRDLLKNLDKLPAQDEHIVVYCASGHRGGMATAALRLLGYTDVVNLGGGMGAWIKAELPLETAELAAPVAGTAPSVDETRLEQLDAFLSALPDGFFTVKAADLNAELAGDPMPVIVDVRTDEELAADGYIEGSVHIVINDLMSNLSELPAEKDAPIVVTCKSGHRGAFALMALSMNGYTNVRNLGGGMNAWIAAELPVVK